MLLAHVVLDLTMLRYLVPFSKRLRQFIPSIEQRFYLPRHNGKYNGLATDGNFKRAQDIIQEHCPYASIADGQGEFDVVVQVETGNHLNARHRISIQHGFDYTFKAQELAGQVGAYITSSEYAAKDATRLGIKAIASPCPVCMWDHEGPKDVCQTAVVLYPDQGDVHVADDVIQRLEGMGYSVFTKQRRKHQPISGGGTHVYDDVWYPSEAIELPLTSAITVGFGSSAYTDLVPMGVPYMNIDLHPNDGRWSTFVHPGNERPNYVRVSNIDDVGPGLTVLAGLADIMPRLWVDVEQIRTFLLGLFNAHFDG